MEFKYASGIYSFCVTQVLPITLEESWQFFSDPENLEKITPNNLSFNITSELDGSFYDGQIITYKIGILPLIKSNWVTEIKNIDWQKSFIDEQRYGPYKMWNHRHTFEECVGGTLIKDQVQFKLPFNFLRAIVFPVIIKPKLTKIFTHRKQILSEHFG